MDFDRPRVLVIDDDRDSAESVASLLKIRGFLVRFVVEPTDALTIAEEFKPDAALVDIVMRPKSGYEVISELRSQFPEITIVAYSGWCTPEYKTKALALGADRFLAKPSQTERIRAALMAGRRPICDAI